MTKTSFSPRENLYHQIQHKPLTFSNREIIQMLDLARFDPRLMEIITELLRDFWWTLDPDELKKGARKARSPFMLKIATLIILEYCQISQEDRHQYVEWLKSAVRGLKDPAPQLMYIGVYPIGSTALRRQVEESLPCLLKHNIILKDLPFNKGQPKRLRSEKSLPENKLDEVDLLKLKYARLLKKIKKDRKLSHDELIRITGINRVFLSKIFNNKYEDISLEYLKEKLIQSGVFKK